MPPTVRAVLDPNVLISAAISDRGAPFRILQAARESAFEMISSERLLFELEDVLMRRKFRHYFAEHEAADYILSLRRVATLAEEGEILPITLDPKDDYLVALAWASRADFIISGDSHLLELEREDLPEIIPPRAFLERDFS